MGRKCETPRHSDAVRVKRRLSNSLGFRLLFLVGVPAAYCAVAAIGRTIERHDAFQHHAGRHLLWEGENCTPPAILDFPADLFTPEQRRAGAVVLHGILACYLFVLLALVCDDYFVPSIKKMCNKLGMSEDVAGATFMAAATSSPELFINTVGTFITEGDLGVGTIVGSAVFNILAVPACCGLFAGQVVTLEWWPLTRDCSMYGLAVILLIFTLQDGRVEWYEALVLVCLYFLYISVMYFNTSMGHWLKGCCKTHKPYKQVPNTGETSPLLKQEDNHITYDSELQIESKSLKMEDDPGDEGGYLCEWPGQSSVFAKLWWVFVWPISYVLCITIPDCRQERWQRFYPLTFVMCILWIGTTSYMVAWMITVIGDTLQIPDSVMGLTFLAAGTSVPEAVSSVIVTNQGHGSMGISNSIGSNTFDILLCLGLPWLIKSAFLPTIPGTHYVTINSGGIEYSAVSLLSTLLILYLSFVLNKFKLDRKIGIVCLLIYIAFLSFASLIELNVFFNVNIPTCPR